MTGDDRAAATRAYALTILEQYQDFSRNGPSRSLTDEIKDKVRGAQLPTFSAQQIKDYATDPAHGFPPLP